MPAKSVKQRRAAGMARAAQKGEIPMSSLKGAAKSMAQMKPASLKEYAESSEKGLPKRVRRK